ncbi:hypothetical protein HK405_007876, partial [Cladochytrium tenue]
CSMHPGCLTASLQPLPSPPRPPLPPLPRLLPASSAAGVVWAYRRCFAPCRFNQQIKIRRRAPRRTRRSPPNLIAKGTH